MNIQTKKRNKKYEFLVAFFIGLMLLPLMSCIGKTENNKTNIGMDDMAKKEETLVAKPKRIGVIGAGWLGGTVGSLWVKAGHEVMFSSRHPEELKEMAAKLGPNASVGTIAEAAAYGDILLFAVPYDAMPQLGKDLEKYLNGKVVLDACNGGSGDLASEVAVNGAGPTSAKYLKGSLLVRAFSSEDATAVEASFNRKNNKLAVPLAGNDKEAVEIAAQLIIDAGCVPIIVGDLSTGVKFQRNTPAFRANTNVSELRKLLGLPEEK